MRAVGASLWVLVLLALAARGADVIPLPVEATSAAGVFTLAADSVIVAHPRARAEAALLGVQLSPATGFALTTAVGSRSAIRRRTKLCARRPKRPCRTWIAFERARDRTMGDEGYRLDVDPGRITIRARTPAGFFYGAQTLRQLLPAAVLGRAVVTDVPWTVSAQRIRDAPRFGWRGVLLDSARHVQPPVTVLRLIDQMALHKLNRLHWHLTDDQGWRLEVRAFPELTRVGAMRAESPVRVLPTGGFLNFLVPPPVPAGDGIPYAGHYTRDDVRTIVAYAAARHVEIVPEIDMPGHIQAAIAAYPHLGSEAAAVAVRTTWGLPTEILSPREETFAFIGAVLDEVVELFPGRFVHMGGDEVSLVHWETNADAQAAVATLGLADTLALKRWFVNRVMQMIVDRGRRPMGWNEVLHDGLLADGVVTIWTSPALALEATALGHDVVMAPLLTTYLDHANPLPLPPAEQAVLETQGAAVQAVAAAFTTSVAELHAFEPVQAGMTRAQTARVLGGQGQLWSEFIVDQTDLDRQAFPRLAALAEVLWSPGEARDLLGFEARLRTHLGRLDALGIGYWRSGEP